MDFDDQDAPPDLVEAGDTLSDEETSIKVPITIVTGVYPRSIFLVRPENYHYTKYFIPMNLGYLGAGKTTLLNYILTAQHGKKIAVIMNGITPYYLFSKSVSIANNILEFGDCMFPLRFHGVNLTITFSV